MPMARLEAGLVTALPDDVIEAGGQMHYVLAGEVVGERVPGAGGLPVEYEIRWGAHSAVAHDLVQWADWESLSPWKKGKHSIPPKAWVMWGAPLEEVSEFKYLGVWFHKHLHEKVHCAKMASKAAGKQNMLMSMVGHNEGFGLAMNHVIRLYEAYVLSAASYGMEFCPNHGPETMDKINRNMCRWLCKAYRRYTPRQNIRLEMGLPDGTAMVWRRHMVLQGILQRMDPGRVQHGIHQQLLQQVDTGAQYPYRSGGNRIRKDLSWEQAMHGLCRRLLPLHATVLAKPMLRWGEMAMDRDCDKWNRLLKMMDNLLNYYSADGGQRAFHWSIYENATGEAWNRASKAQFSRACAYMAKFCTMWRAQSECRAGGQKADYMTHFEHWGGWYVHGPGPQPYLCFAQQLSKTRQIFNLRTANSVLRTHKRTVGENNHCPFCEDRPETVYHFVMECPFTEYHTAREIHGQLLETRWDQMLVAMAGDYILDTMRETDPYNQRWATLSNDKRRTVGVILGHPPLTAKLVPSGTLENWLKAGELRNRWDSFLAASNTMLCNMLKVRRIGMRALSVNDAEPSSGEEDELAATDEGVSDGPAP